MFLVKCRCALTVALKHQPIRQIWQCRTKPAVIDDSGSHSYANLGNGALKIADEIKNKLGAQYESKSQHRIALLTPRNKDYTVGLLASWMVNAVCVPLDPTFPPSELQYLVNNSRSHLILTTPELEAFANSWLPKQLPRIAIEDGMLKCSFKEELLKFEKEKYFDQSALIIYTSGTTGRPKGVVLTHKNLHHNVRGMQHSWQWTSNDCLLHVLPLNHVHGVTNCLLTPLAAGATIRMLHRFNPEVVWHHLLDESSSPSNINVFMAVPTIYAKLLDWYDSQCVKDGSFRDKVMDICSSKIRLMVSGSAALPTSLLQRWHQATGHILLERYGMTEVGMALGNSLNGVRHPSRVGQPFPGVQVRIVRPPENLLVQSDSQCSQIFVSDEVELIGELHINSPTIFKEYFENPKATQETFSEDGWFVTGDMASYDRETETYRIEGRTSVDIIKIGGYKISALEIERVLLEHIAIKEVAVLGLPDEKYGQKIVALIALKEGENKPTSEEFHNWAKEVLASYKLPRDLHFLSELPRNAMGKINKKQLVKQYFD